MGKNKKQRERALRGRCYPVPGGDPPSPRVDLAPALAARSSEPSSSASAAVPGPPSAGAHLAPAPAARYPDPSSAPVPGSGCDPPSGAHLALAPVARNPNPSSAAAPVPGPRCNPPSAGAHRAPASTARNPDPSSSSAPVPLPGGEPSSARAHLSAPVVGVASSSRSGPPPDKFNYAINLKTNEGTFIKYLEYGNPQVSSYDIPVFYHKMQEFNDINLIIATCKSLCRLEEFLLPAARRFLKQKGFGNDEDIQNKTGLFFIGFPASVHKFEEFLSGGDLVQEVSVFWGRSSVLVATPHGRHLIAMLIDALFESNSKGISSEGTFSITDIVIIVDESGFKYAKILKNTVGEDKSEKKMSEALAKDLHRIDGLIMPYYQAQIEKNGLKYCALPVYFPQLKEALQGATSELVAKEWFREYMSYHVAFMPSSARRYFETALYVTCKNCKVGYIPVLDEKPDVYHIDWKTALMKPNIMGINDIFLTVYDYPGTDPYNDKVRGLMKYKRNFLEHGGQGQPDGVKYIAELELCAANMYSEFLPSLLCTLLEQGLMQRVFREAWNDFKGSRWAKSDPWSN